jgi:hypothetical protein
LEDHLELPPAQCSPDQLISITKFLVSLNFEIRKEALDRFFKSHSMLEEFVALEIILEVFGRESAPIDHTPFYYGSAEKNHVPFFVPPAAPACWVGVTTVNSATT